MLVIFAVLGLVMVVAIGLVVVGRETARLSTTARAAVFDVSEAVDFIADRLLPTTQARISHDDVRWLLLADAELLEVATADPEDRKYPWSRQTRLAQGRDLPVREASAGEAGDSAADGAPGPVVDEDVAVARLIGLAEAAGREFDDEDLAAVLAGRLGYLEAIGAVGGQVDGKVAWSGNPSPAGAPDETDRDLP